DLLDKANAANAKVRGALFELTDEEVRDRLTALGARFEVVLADGAPADTDECQPDDPGAPAALDENCDARKKLHASHAVVHDRMCHAKFLGHNKFLVIAGDDGNPRYTWTGSTNLTATGLCTQVNNGLLVDDPTLAARFWDQVDLLAAAGNNSPASLAKANSK